MCKAVLGFWVMLTIGILSSSVVAIANPMPMQWDHVTINNWGNGLDSGGIFYLTNGSYTVPVFCVETAAEFTPGTSYTIYDVSKNVLSQGINVSGLLSHRTDALVYLFSSSQLRDFDSTAEAQASLQYLVWKYQSQNTTGYDFNIPWRVTSYDQQVNALISNYSPDYDFGSVVLNIGILQANFSYSDNQSQVWNPGSTPTPEPSSVLLIGTGLLGIAAFARKLRS
jgi:hypothetical protein